MSAQLQRLGSGIVTGVVENIAFAGGYLSKAVIKKALAEVRTAQPHGQPHQLLHLREPQQGQEHDSRPAPLRTSPGRIAP